MTQNRRRSRRPPRAVSYQTPAIPGSPVAPVASRAGRRRCESMKSRTDASCIAPAREPLSASGRRSSTRAHAKPAWLRDDYQRSFINQRRGDDRRIPYALRLPRHCSTRSRAPPIRPVPSPLPGVRGVDLERRGPDLFVQSHLLLWFAVICPSASPVAPRSRCGGSFADLSATVGPVPV